MLVADDLSESPMRTLINTNVFDVVCSSAHPLFGLVMRILDVICACGANPNDQPLPKRMLSADEYLSNSRCRD